MLPLPAEAAKKAIKKAPKKAAVTTVMDKDWQKTFSLMKDKDPVAAKLLTWIYATETNLPMEAKDLIRFADENPGWPRLGDFREKIEESIGESGMRPHEIADWFRRNPPESYEGFKALMTALSALGQPAEAQKAADDFWREAELDKNETAAAVSRFSAYLPPTRHAARLDALIWEGRYAEAEYMLAFAPPEARAAGQARIALARLSTKAPALLDAVSPAARDTEGVLYERVRWYRRKDNDDKALALLGSVIQRPVGHPEAWWTEQNILARRMIEKGDFTSARALIARHQMKDGVEYAQAEWMLGWLDLRFLKAPTGAYQRFGMLYNTVQSAISRSRTAFWAARAAEALNMKEQSQQWDRVSAFYLSTYYGQLSYRRAYGAPAQKPADVPPTAEASKAFEARELVHAVRVLDHTGLEQCLDPFLAKLVAEAKTRTDFQLTARLAHAVGRDYYAVQANKDIQQRLGDYMLNEGYPVLSKSPFDQPEKALVHAIVYRESMFNPTAVSAADARGLMQLMPATAKSISKKKKKKYAKDKLTADPHYNVQIGAAYLASLVDDYDGKVPMAIAAYNAGPGNVAEWVGAFGNPAQGTVPWVDWVEMISNYETRNYVQRVMETWYMYRLKFGQKPVTVEDFRG